MNPTLGGGYHKKAPPALGGAEGSDRLVLTKTRPIQDCGISLERSCKPGNFRNVKGLLCAGFLSNNWNYLRITLIASYNCLSAIIFKCYSYLRRNIVILITPYRYPYHCNKQENSEFRVPAKAG